MSLHSNALPASIGVEIDSQHVSLEELVPICAAIQRQINQDVAPAWHVGATVQAFPNGQVPFGYWKVMVEDGLGVPGAAGYHDDDHRQPYAKVDALQPDLSVTLSHEIIEMLVDPAGFRLWSAASPRDHLTKVRVLIEACDPCENQTYDIDGIQVSDFVLPTYYRHHKLGFTRTCHISDLAPLTIDVGGYLSWVDADGQWEQATWFGGGQPSIRTLGKLNLQGHSPRSFIDQLTREFRTSEFRAS